MRRLLPIVIDLVLVFVFATIGRASHAEALTFDGILRTALPFVAAALLAWIMIVLRRWNLPWLKQGAFVWAVTLVAGMFFRTMVGDGVQVAFVVVAALFLALFLIGWRGLAHLLGGRRQQATTGPREKDPRRSGNPARRNAARRGDDR